jgi:hypothetical protein
MYFIYLILFVKVFLITARFETNISGQSDAAREKKAAAAHISRS